MPSTTLREISLLQMLSESNHIVKWVQSSMHASAVAGRAFIHTCTPFLQADVSGAHRGEQQAMPVPGARFTSASAQLCMPDLCLPSCPMFSPSCARCLNT